MTKIYIDSDFHCHAEAATGRRSFETDFFDGKCAAMIEAYMYLPKGETWTRSDGVTFSGEMICPNNAAAYKNALISQAQYEADEQAHLEEMAALIEEIYNEDLEVIGE